mgnify:CR=1 FL=1
MYTKVHVLILVHVIGKIGFDYDFNTVNGGVKFMSHQIEVLLQCQIEVDNLPTYY